MARTLAQRWEAEAQETKKPAKQTGQNAVADAARKKMDEDEAVVRQLKEKLERKLQAATGAAPRGTEKETREDTAMIALSERRANKEASHEVTGITQQQTFEGAKLRSPAHAIRPGQTVAKPVAVKGPENTRPEIQESFNDSMAQLQRRNAARPEALSANGGIRPTPDRSMSFAPNVQKQTHKSVSKKSQASAIETRNSTQQVERRIPRLTPMDYSNEQATGPRAIAKPGTGSIEERQPKQAAVKCVATTEGTSDDDDIAVNEILELLQLFTRERGQDPDVRARGLEILGTAYKVNVRQARRSGKKVALVLREAVLDMDEMLKKAGASWAPVQKIASTLPAKDGHGGARAMHTSRGTVKSSQDLNQSLHHLDHTGPDLPVQATSLPPNQVLQLTSRRDSERATKPVMYEVNEQIVDPDDRPAPGGWVSKPVPRAVVSPVSQPATDSNYKYTWFPVPNKEIQKDGVVLEHGVERGNRRQRSATQLTTPNFPLPPPLPQDLSTGPKRKRTSSVRLQTTEPGPKTCLNEDGRPSLVVKLPIRIANQVLGWRTRKNTKNKLASTQQKPTTLPDESSTAQPSKAKRQKPTDAESPRTSSPKSKRQKTLHPNRTKTHSPDPIEILSDDSDPAWETISPSTKRPNSHKPSLTRRINRSSTQPRQSSPSLTALSKPSTTHTLPPLPSRDHAPFHLGLITALENIHEDHTRNPSWHVADIIKELQDNKAQHARGDWRMRAVLKGAQWGYEAVAALAGGTKGQRVVDMGTRDLCWVVGKWAEKGFVERGWGWPVMRFEGGRWEWDWEWEGMEDEGGIKRGGVREEVVVVEGDDDGDYEEGEEDVDE